MKGFFSNSYFYHLIVLILITSTAMILSTLREVRKISFEARHGIDRDVFPVSEASGENDFVSISYGASISREGLLID